jgi:ribosome-associated translation inhibitor RaiA
MHIQIDGDESISRQTRAYAEYRLFAALAPLSDARRFGNVSLVLRREKNRRRGGRVVCAVAVEARDGVVARFKAAGTHPYEAIDRAVDRVRLAA